MVVAILIAILSTLQPYSRTPPAHEFPTTAPFGDLDLSDWNYRAIKLDQHWQWHPEQLVSPGKISNDAEHKAVALPHYFSGQQHLRGERQNFGSYRLRLKLPKNAHQQNLSLSLSFVCNSATVFFYPLGSEQNQIKPILEVGKVSKESKGHSAELGRFHASLPLQQNKLHYELLIQVAGHNSPNPGLCQAPVIATGKSIQRLEQLQQINQGFIVAIILSFGLYAIGTSIAGSRNRSYLWIGSAAVLVALTKASLGNFYNLTPDESINGSYRFSFSLLYSTILLGGALILGFIHHSFKVNFFSHRLVKANLLIAFTLSLPLFLLPASYSRDLIFIVACFACVQYLLVLYLLRQALQNRLMYARRITLYTLPLLIAAPVEFAKYLGFLGENQLLVAAIVFLVVAQGLNQSQKLARVSKLASRLSQGLGDAVQKQTADLHLKNQELLKTQQELTKANQELRALSVTDGLTSVYNRMYFDRQFIAEWQRSRRDQKHLCLMLIDVDHFKKINDEFGHSAGDGILRRIAKVLQSHFKRGSDIVCRYGGEEFIVILSDSTTTQAGVLAEQLRQKVEQEIIEYLESRLHITISIGVCGLTPGPEHQPLDLLNATDQALYKAKREGRNCVRVSSAPAPNKSKKN